MSDALGQILELVRTESLDMKALSTAFDAASHDVRIQAIRHFTPKIQRRLFDAAEGQRVTLTQIIPTTIPAMRPVRHHGQNTLPAFRQFEKRFCRPESGQDANGREVLWGYNHQAFSLFTGPGYYVAYDDPATGEVCVDYRELPPGKPEEWPAILSNKARLGILVYYNMVDRLRRVSEHVTIGRAYKGKPMSAWFTLVRED
jgi:hypothetical protein